MPNKHNLRKVVQAISIAATAIGEYLTDGADYIKFEGDASNPIIATRTNTVDNMVGDGRAFDKQSKPQSFDPRNIPYNGLLTTKMGVRIMRMFIGGSVTTVTNTLPATVDSTVHQKESGETPLMCNIFRNLGGEQNNHGDTFVQTVNITQTGKEQPRISVQLQNTGHLALLSDAGIDPADANDLPSYLIYDGNLTKLTFTDGVDNYDFAGDQMLCEVGFQGNQNVIVEGLPNDPYYDAAHQCYGSYAGSANIDVQSANITAKVYMDDNFDIFLSWLANKKITDVKLLFKSCEIIGSTTHHAELEIIIPIAEFTLQGDANRNQSAYTINIKGIEGDPSDGSLCRIRVRQVGAVS